MAVVMVVVMAGIIPARAGFTSSRGAARCASRDHPRSRGVYVGAARVLGELDGIIPARAGFTTPATCRGPCTWDHPRSRGVYRVCYSLMHITAGSSPLARGLPQAQSSAPAVEGIIPARAGFTSDGWVNNDGPEDHPRSRGVYTGQHPTRPACSGSSPLARGLPDVQATTAVGGGIIPARAGFTLTGHGALLSAEGSSPLARGLPWEALSWPPCGGIIPARAGFTRRRARRPALRGDHPRSRGVYRPPRRRAPPG